MTETKCIGCADPVLRFIELHNNPSILCSSCRKSTNYLSSNFTTDADSSKPDKKSDVQLWNQLYKYSIKFLRSFSPSYAGIQMTKAKGFSTIMNKLKRIFEKSMQKSKIVKKIKYLYKHELPKEEKINFLKNMEGVFLELANFYEAFEIVLESYVVTERSKASAN
ncbi:hypothetical protein SteCoe_26352 [Stentor coeruleus]|uniref:Uncharacterized protein n=1 Tax=Stentor coeruleus TaxID=5963 RepID=A0A1R2BD34_9CILI|nr:hypothetical protein SteCoe_26352 [Stentor coeruleus]